MQNWYPDDDPTVYERYTSVHPQIKTGRAAKIHVIALDGSLPVHADGETICTAGSELRIEIIKQPIDILDG